MKSNSSWAVFKRAVFLLAIPFSAGILLAVDEATQADTEGVTIDAAEEVAGAPMVSPELQDRKMAWWREAKFGMFIHWGIYSVPAGTWGEETGHGEWIMHSARIPVSEYRKLAKEFYPSRYDPAQWARIAREAGMRYIVITSKHHDGFALFPSDVSDWDVRDATPWENDLIAPLASAARREGLKFGVYYSQAQDWNNPGGAKARYEEGEYGWDPEQGGSFDAYLEKLALPQVKELLTRYPLDILWWDTPTWMNPQRTKPFYEYALQFPDLVMNNRLGEGFRGDTATPEQFVPVTGYPGDWETCMTMNRHWGYNKHDLDFKSATELIRKLADICGKGGNLLLNVGPTAKGEFPRQSIDALREIGAWMELNGESIYGTQAGPFKHLSWGTATSKDDLLYLHVFDWPQDGQLKVPLLSEVQRASLMASPELALPIRREAERWVVSLPEKAPDPANSVVVLQLAGPPKVLPLPTGTATVTASAEQADAVASHVLDGTAQRRWRAPEQQTEASLQIDLGKAALISGYGCDEPDVWPRMKQNYVIEALLDRTWVKLAEGTTKGHGFVGGFDAVKARVFRISLTCATGAPGLAEVQLYQPE
jgi:alpha-L-fucosidase